jgi:hypothetical protein
MCNSGLNKPCTTPAYFAKLKKNPKFRTFHTSHISIFIFIAKLSTDADAHTYIHTLTSMDGVTHTLSLLFSFLLGLLVLSVILHLFSI